MKYFKKSSAWLILILCINHGNSNKLSITNNEETFLKSSRIIARTMLGVGGTFVPYFKVILSLWDGVEELVDSKRNSDSISETNEEIDRLSHRIAKVSEDIQNYYISLDNSLGNIIDEVGKLYPKLKDVYRMITSIESDFNSLMFALQRNHTYENTKPQIEEIRKYGSAKLWEMVNYWTENRDFESVIKLLQKPSLKFSLVCSKQASIQQIIYNHYRAVQRALMIGLWLALVAHEEHEELSKSAKKNAFQIAIDQHLHLMNGTTHVFRNYTSVSSRDMWRCDPDIVKQGETYERFGRAFQKYLFNERNIQPHGQTDTDDCPGTCEDIPGPLYVIAGQYWTHENETHRNSITTGPHWAETEKGRYHMHSGPPKHHCAEGILKNCQTIKDEKLAVCPGREDAIEKYVYINSSSWTYGSKSSCYDLPQEIEVPKTHFVDNTIDFLERTRLTKLCSFCMCTCQYDLSHTWVKGNSPEKYAAVDTDRFIDLKPVEADKGHVVTGVSLTKNSTTHTFHLQINQAKLLPHGRVSKSHWKNITTYYPGDFVWNSVGLKETKYREGKDYHTIKYNNTIIYLDNVMLDNDNLVLTGVKFKIHANESGKIHLGLVSKLSRFNFTSGNISEDEEWHPKTVEKMINRNRVQIDDSDLPTKFNKQNREIKDRSSYVEVINSGLEVDIGQNVLPFIDIQPVDTLPAVPLAGVGLYHRGCRGSGGYIGLKPIIIDLMNYMPTEKFIERIKNSLLT